MININLEAKSFPELYEKLVALIRDIQPGSEQPSPTPAQPTPAPAASTAAIAAPTAAPSPVPTAAAQTAPVAPVAPAAPSAPVAPVPVAPAPGYTLEQLARATAILSDQNRMSEIQALFAQFGITRLDALPVDAFGAYAATLRQMGVQI